MAGKADAHALMAERASLLRRVEEIDATLRARPPLAGTTFPNRPPAGVDARELRNGVVALLEREQRPWRAFEVVEELRRQGVRLADRAHAHVRSTLARLVREGVVARVALGTYCIAAPANEQHALFATRSPGGQPPSSARSGALLTVESTQQLPGG